MQHDGLIYIHPSHTCMFAAANESRNYFEAICQDAHDQNFGVVFAAQSAATNLPQNLVCLSTEYCLQIYAWLRARLFHIQFGI